MSGDSRDVGEKQVRWRRLRTLKRQERCAPREEHRESGQPKIRHRDIPAAPLARVRKRATNGPHIRNKGWQEAHPQRESRFSRERSGRSGINSFWPPRTFDEATRPRVLPTTHLLTMPGCAQADSAPRRAKSAARRRVLNRPSCWSRMTPMRMTPPITA